MWQKGFLQDSGPLALGCFAEMGENGVFQQFIWDEMKA